MKEENESVSKDKVKIIHEKQKDGRNHIQFWKNGELRMAVCVLGEQETCLETCADGLKISDMEKLVRKAHKQEIFCAAKLSFENEDKIIVETEPSLVSFVLEWNQVKVRFQRYHYDMTYAEMKSMTKDKLIQSEDYRVSVDAELMYSEDGNEFYLIQEGSVRYVLKEDDYKKIQERDYLRKRYENSGSFFQFASKEDRVYISKASLLAGKDEGNIYIFIEDIDEEGFARVNKLQKEKGMQGVGKDTFCKLI